MPRRRSQGEFVEIRPATNLADTYSGWIEARWGYLPVCDWLKGESPRASALPHVLGMTDVEGDLVGAGAILADDMTDRPQWNPWLACLFVTPPNRGLGIGARLSTQLVGYAKATCPELYLFCEPNLEHFYKRLGFLPIESRSYEGHLTTVMKLRSS